jgi:leader peptidase (prepilin peptidase)/N-methyltransferase
MPLLVVAGVLGLAVGSFANVVIYRVPRAESLVRPGSRCAHCQTPIKPWHNVPVLSWLALRGKCAHCGERISTRYPLVEAATAALFVAVTARFGPVPELPAYLYLAAIGIILAMIDFDVHRLPNAIVLPSYLVGAALLAPAVIMRGDWGSAARGLLATAALGGFYFVLAWAYPAGMGLGDVKLAGLLGLYLGWLSWGSVLVGTFAGFALGAVVGVALMATGRAHRRTAVPFGPAMLAGALLALFVAGPVTAWYSALLTPNA